MGATAVKSHINTHKHIHMAALHLEKPCPTCNKTEIDYSLCYAMDCTCKICSSRKINDERNRKEAKRIKMDSEIFEKRLIEDHRITLKEVEDELNGLKGKLNVARWAGSKYDIKKIEDQISVKQRIR